ncbi:outer membrane protein [Tateyamaria sp. SN3-11]|uniref:outer membrane protein n=1 Tax=Tateyamaria sp. SN3-11 TaxID=3092147 RepID=UPI0039E8EDD5
MTRPHIPVLCIAMTLAAPALADGDVYFKAFGGLSDLRSDSLTFGGAGSTADYDTGAIFGGALGYDYAGSPWRSEIEFAYRSSDATLGATLGTGGDFASTSVMINGIYAFPTAGALAPYVGVGLGVMTEVDFDIDAGPAAGEYNDTGVFAAQLMVGADYAVSERVGLFGELRYFTAGAQTLEAPGGAVLDADYDSIDALVGLSIRF